MMIYWNISNLGCIPVLLEDERISYSMDGQEGDAAQARKCVVIYRLNCFKGCHYCGEMAYVQRGCLKKNKGAGTGTGANMGQVHVQDDEVKVTTKEEPSQGETLDLTEDSMRDIADRAAAKSDKETTDTVLATISEAAGTGGDTANRMNISLGF